MPCTVVDPGCTTVNSTSPCPCRDWATEEELKLDPEMFHFSWKCERGWKCAIVKCVPGQEYCLYFISFFNLGGYNYIFGFSSQYSDFTVIFFWWRKIQALSSRPGWFSQDRLPVVCGCQLSISSLDVRSVMPASMTWALAMLVLLPFLSEGAYFGTIQQ